MARAENVHAIIIHYTRLPFAIKTSFTEKFSRREEVRTSTYTMYLMELQLRGALKKY